MPVETEEVEEVCCPRCGVEETNFCSRCEDCPSCCECNVCPCCNEVCGSTCSRCDECGRCCSCQSCQNCYTLREAVCRDCDRCEDCCTCSGESDECVVKTMARRVTFYNAGKKEFIQNSSKRFIACELEYSDARYGGNIEAAARKWKCSIVGDGSLPDSGFEICTSPANGDVFINQIEDLTQALAEGDAEVNTDCGFHVHIDAQDFRYWDIRKLIIFYEKIEQGLFDMVPKSRRGNTYCLPCGDRYLKNITACNRPKQMKKQLIHNVYKEVPDKLFKDKRAEHRVDARYYALNIHSWFYRGTIECRLAAGTRDPIKIINWSLLWVSIIDFVNRESESTIKGMSGSDLEILLRVAPESIHQWVIERTNQHKGK